MRHPDTFLSVEELGSKFPEYKHTYQFDGFIDTFHEKLQTCSPLNDLVDLGIDGWLRHADALKLYEMAYFAQRDILELGTYHGLSTYIMAQAAGEKRIVSVDISPDAHAIARKNLEGFVIEFILSDAVQAIKRLNGRKFGFIFVDHSHAYQPVLEVCRAIDKVSIPGAYALFHDWNDPRNGNEPDYGVYQATRDGLNSEWEFCGCYGCTALYQYIPPNRDS